MRQNWYSRSLCKCRQWRKKGWPPKWISVKSGRRRNIGGKGQWIRTHRNVHRTERPGLQAINDGEPPSAIPGNYGTTGDSCALIGGIHLGMREALGLDGELHLIEQVVNNFSTGKDLNWQIAAVCDSTVASRHKCGDSAMNISGGQRRKRGRRRRWRWNWRRRPNITEVGAGRPSDRSGVCKGLGKRCASRV